MEFLHDYERQNNCKKDRSNHDNTNNSNNTNNRNMNCTPETPQASFTQLPNGWCCLKCGSHTCDRTRSECPKYSIPVSQQAWQVAMDQMDCSTTAHVPTQVQTAPAAASPDNQSQVSSDSGHWGPHLQSVTLSPQDTANMSLLIVSFVTCQIIHPHALNVVQHTKLPQNESSKNKPQQTASNHHETSQLWQYKTSSTAPHATPSHCPLPCVPTFWCFNPCVTQIMPISLKQPEWNQVLTAQNTKSAQFSAQIARVHLGF